MGYDQYCGCYRGAIAGAAGADFSLLCYPGGTYKAALILKMSKRGLIASKIAAHAADIAKGCSRCYGERQTDGALPEKP